jgi:hypothetical protein
MLLREELLVVDCSLDVQLGWHKKGVSNVIGECILKYPTGRSRRKLEKFVKRVVAKLVVRLWVGLDCSGFDIKISGTIFDITKCFRCKSQIWFSDKHPTTRMMLHQNSVQSVALTHNILCVHSSTRHNEVITTTDRLSASHMREVSNASLSTGHMREVSNALLITHQAGDDSVLSTIGDIRTGRPSLRFWWPAYLTAAWKKGLYKSFTVEFNFRRGKGTAMPGQAQRVPVGWGS